MKLTLSDGNKEFSVDLESIKILSENGLPCISGSRWPVFLALVDLNVEEISQKYDLTKAMTRELETFTEKLIHLFDNKFIE